MTGMMKIAPVHSDRQSPVGRLPSASSMRWLPVFPMFQMFPMGWV
jgi:hypothetical protein